MLMQMQTRQLNNYLLALLKFTNGYENDLSQELSKGL
jgi:hypothetical protein